MKTNLLLCLLLFALSLAAQERGVAPVEGGKTAQAGTTRAVVVGISRYQSEGIPNLRFADRDAEAFELYLQSPAGGSLPDANIRLLINEKATIAAIAEALDWLVEQSQEGDQAIIYFSGHGDVEAKMAHQPGFLLCYDSPPKIYFAGAFPLFYLQEIIETLSSKKNVLTIVITDACRAGKLAGSAIGGTQATAANLAKQYANEIKILSCQPNEFSLEGEQWGGGRGAFSYHLIEGLIGLADRNDNGHVNLLELENYLETIVPAETDPQSQIPMTVGSKGTNIADVDAGVLARLKDLKARQLPTLAAIESRGVEETLLAHVDTSIQEKYEAFITALEHKNLLDGTAGQPSADDLYRELMQEESLASLHRFMTRRFATTLQDDAQQAINAYLQANPTELEKRWKGDTSYTQYPRYLDRAAELLGNSHYMHDYLLAKKYYFEGLNLRLLADQRSKNGSYKKAIEKQEAALALEDRAAFFYNELGVLHTRLKSSEKAVDYYEKAIELAPQWGLPYVNLCLEYYYSNNNKKAIETGEKALNLLPDYPQLYNLLGWVHADYYPYAEKSNWWRQGVELNTDFYYSLDWISTYSDLLDKFRVAIGFLEKAIELDSNFAAAHANLGPIYRQTGEYEKAAFHLKKAIQLDSTNAESYIHLGQVYYSIRRLEEGEAVLNQALKLSSQLPTSTKAWAYQSKGWTYLLWGKYDQAISSFKQSIALDGRNPWTYKGLGDVYVGLDDLQKAEWYYLKAREVNDQYPITHLWVGDICKRLNRYADAEWSYLRALEVFPDHKQALHDLINLYQETGQQELAQKWQQKLVALSPDDPLVHIQHGQLAYVNKQFDAAEKHFKKAMILSKGELWVPSDIGSFYYKHSEDSLAESYMKHILTKDSTYWSPYYYLPNILNAGGRKSEAISLANSGLARATTTLDQLRIVAGLCNNIIYHSGDMDAYLEYTRQAEAAHPSTKGAALLAQNLKENNFEGAAAILAQLLKIYPTDGPGNYINCHIKIKLGKFEEAVEALDKALGTTQISFQQVQNDPKLNPIQQRHRFQQLMRKHFPEKYDDLDTFEFIQEKPIYYPENCVAMANYYNRRGEPERAKFMYEKAVELKPDPPTQELAMMLAEVYLKQGKYEEAKAICPDELEPDDVEEHLSIGQLYYQLGRPDKAEAHFTAYVQKGSRSNRAQQVAWFYHQHGECDLAGQYLRKAVLIQPGSYRPFYDLGWLYFSCGDTKKAILLMDEGIRAFPAEFDLKGIKAMILALSDPSDQPGKAFAALETEQPDMAQIGTCLDLMRAKKYEEATAAYQTITKGIDDWWVRRMLRFAYVRMLVAKGDLDAAMDEIDKGDTWIFSYPLLYGDDTLAPLRGTERFRAFVQRKFPEKAR